MRQWIRTTQAEGEEAADSITKERDEWATQSARTPYRPRIVVEPNFAGSSKLCLAPDWPSPDMKPATRPLRYVVTLALEAIRVGFQNLPHLCVCCEQVSHITSGCSPEEQVSQTMDQLRRPNRSLPFVVIRNIFVKDRGSNVPSATGHDSF